MAFTATPLGEHIGTEIHAGINELLTPATGVELRRLLTERGVLVFKELHPTDEQQIALASLMGKVREELGKSIYKITLSKDANAHADYLKGSFLWHIDGTHDKIPPFATLLTARVLSKTGGQTEFANSYSAYDALPDEMKCRIDSLRVVHSVETSMRRAGIEATDENLAYWRRFPPTTHRLVWTHESGRKSLVIGCHASHIAGMDHDEGEALIQALIGWATQDRFIYRHEWTPGDMLVWDNTGVMHRAEPYPMDSGRIMHRCMLLGEEAFSE
jgi:alpha-ketoglutarate-dependent taurine dioxygenase